MPEHLLALDVGTTSARALIVGPTGLPAALARRRVISHHPAPGLVEQDAGEVWRLAESAMAEALATAGLRASDIAAIGVTSQRASIVLWDRNSGEPVAPMIVWSDLRGIARAADLAAAGFPPWPQMPCAKLEAALDLLPDGRARAERGELAWGTLDSYLVWRLSGGDLHVTDFSNAWVSGYLDFAAPDRWNAGLLAFQNLPERLFPRLTPSWGMLGTARAGCPGAPITALLADQQAGLLAHGSLERGAWKAAFGTSAVVMVSTGQLPFTPHPTMPLLALARGGGRDLFCFEGMVASAGSFLEWLAGGLGLFPDVPALEAAAGQVRHAAGTALRPSLQGLGAPHGRFDARALIAGLTPATGRNELARAALEGLAFRVREIIDVIAADGTIPLVPELSVDGGTSAGDVAMQIQADMLGRPLHRLALREGTALGAAFAAGLGVGLLTEADLPGLVRHDRTFEPALTRDQSDAAYAAWRAALADTPVSG